MTSTRRADHEAALARRLQHLGEEVAGRRTVSGAPVQHPAAAAAPAAPGPPSVPRPGRHASRRAGRLAGLLPEAMRGRVALGPGTLAVVAVVVALGLAVTAWWVVRTEPSLVTPVEPQPAPALASSAIPAPTPTAEDAAATSQGTVTVDVAGKVRRPGIAVLDAGARVVDALKAAGGARPGVDLTGLNLARVLVDGEQIVVGLPASATAPPAAPVGSATAGPLVDLNTATTVDLEALPEVGPVTAQAILAWRDQNGGFTSVSELLEVDGIGDATLAAVAPFVTV